MLSEKLLDALHYRWEPHTDQRGKWQRVWDKSSLFLSENRELRQASISVNDQVGTLRGMHMMTADANEWKSVVCILGKVQDVIVDMRPWSQTYLEHASVVLSGDDNDGIHIPPGFAHGFLTLEPNSILLYLMTADYDAQKERAYRWDDPRLSIPWLLKPTLVSDKDSSHALLI